MNKFFVGLLPDQLQTADRAWEVANYLVDNYFTATGNLWYEIQKHIVPQSEEFAHRDSKDSLSHLR